MDYLENANAEFPGTLNLGCHRVPSPPPGLDRLPVRTLYLSGNQLTRPPIDLAEGAFPGLQRLWISDNPLQD